MISSLITNSPEQETSLRVLVCFYLIDIYKKAGRIIGTVFMGVKVAIDKSQDVSESFLRPLKPPVSELGMGNGEWGVGSGEWGVSFPTPHSTLTE
jgi:hypothetical protein